MQNTLWQMGWMNHNLESKLPGEILITSDMPMITTLRAEREEKLKSLLMRVKEESEKAVLKLNIQKIKIMASSLITSWQIEGENGETGIDLLSLVSKITVDGNCGHQNKRHLLLGRKAITNLAVVVQSPSCVWLFTTP